MTKYPQIVELFANSGDPDQMPHSVLSNLGLHCLPVTLLKYLDKNVKPDTPGIFHQFLKGRQLCAGFQVPSSEKVGIK